MFVFVAANEKAIPDPTRKNYQKEHFKGPNDQDEKDTYKDLVPDWWSPYFFAKSFNFTRSRQLLAERRDSR
jgi:hypothetical protein